LTAAARADLVAAVRDAARTQILPRFRALAEGDISTKSGPQDLVTAADLAAEAQIIAALSRTMPDVRVIGEEGIAADPSLRSSFASGARLVIVDPVDGTWNFARGLGLFGVILAVVEHGLPVFGMLYDPLLDDWVEAAADGPARMRHADGRAVDLATSAARQIAGMTGYVPLGLYDKPVQAAIAAQIPAFSRLTSLRCSCHEYRLLAQGHVDFVLSGPEPHPWDHAAGVLATQRAGGVTRFLDGTDYGVARRSGVLLSAANPAAWEAVAARFAFLA
jgi:fructose-1,6-bisphosphatase/inositol monophosphatase family enzyme